MQSYKVLEAKIVCKHFLDFLTEERNFFFCSSNNGNNEEKKKQQKFCAGSQKKFTMIDTEIIIMEILTIIACWRIKQNNWGRRKFHFCFVEFN